MKRIFLVLFVLINMCTIAQNRQYPFTMAYCLDGRAQNTSTREIFTSDPQIGYITFYKDKVVVDNKDVYEFWQEGDGVKAFQGPAVYKSGAYAIPVLFVDDNLRDVVLFISMGDIILKSPVYLMEVSDFQALWNQNQGISNNLFISNSTNVPDDYSSSSNNSQGSRSYYNNRYGYKDCHICYGSGTCQTCNGDGLQNYDFGSGDIPCANCLKENGRRTGKCSVCQGTGKVYGLK
ncbi:MAG: hypothetical protein IKW54_02730 [Bacteroidales bacterium]|nr:hypothetical protein [Bacteroidales bacterium]